jgi:Transcriptional regulatory protein, C terminal
MIHRFAELELDTRSFEPRCGADEVIAVEPQVFDVLCFLVEHADRVVAKGELLDSVWGTRFVTESVPPSRQARAVANDANDHADQRPCWNDSLPPGIRCSRAGRNRPWRPHQPGRTRQRHQTMPAHHDRRALPVAHRHRRRKGKWLVAAGPTPSST